MADIHIHVGGRIGCPSDGTTLSDIDLGDPVHAYPALTADGALVIGSRRRRLVAIT